MATREVPAGASAAQQSPITHPKRMQARVLLSSVFGPFARDDEFGSRKINPMELWHNQVTREQGPFSLRMFNRSWGLMMIQANIEAPCTLLDFPTLERFVEEITMNHYDVVGIGAIGDISRPRMGLHSDHKQQQTYHAAQHNKLRRQTGMAQ